LWKHLSTSQKTTKYNQPNAQIERGSVISLDENGYTKYAVLAAVFGAYGSKWHLSVVQDNPTCWPIKDSTSEKGNYRLLVREVEFKEEDGQRMVRVKG